MRNDVPGGASSLLVPPAGVGKAGGARARVLIEHLREQIRALEQVPVSLAIPPAPGAAPPHPACSLLSPPTSVIAGLDPAIHSNSASTRRDVTAWMPGSSPGMTSRKRELPLSQLKGGGLHGLRPESYRDGPAALGFALALIAEQAAERVAGRDLVLWCFTKQAAREWGRPYGPGLLVFGLDPALFLLVQARNAGDAAWALEEGLKSGALIAALAEIEIKTPLVARRLSLAAQASRTPCLLLSGCRAARAARDFDRLAHRGDGKRVRPLRRKRTWHTLLAAHARALPGRGAGAQLYRGVQSWVVSFPSFCRIFRSSG